MVKDIGGIQSNPFLTEVFELFSGVILQKTKNLNPKPNLTRQQISSAPNVLHFAFHTDTSVGFQGAGRTELMLLLLSHAKGR